MKINKNDPRLTAYVLNELSGEEKHLFEKELHSDIELQNEVKRIEKTVGFLKKSFETSDNFQLNPNQREKIFAKEKKSNWSLWALGTSLVTASLALILFQQIAHEPTNDYVVTAPPAMEAVQEAPAEVRSAPAVSLAKRKDSVKAEESLAAADYAAADSLASGAAAPAKSASVKAQAAPVAASRERSAELSVVLVIDDPNINPALAPAFKSCFVEHLSKNVRYNLTYKLKWQAPKLEIEDPQKSGLISAEIKSCVQQGLEKYMPAGKSFEAELKIISN